MEIHVHVHVHVTDKPKQQSTQNWGVGNELVVICLRKATVYK